MPDAGEKLKAVLLTVLMVGSVLGGAAVVATPAAAVDTVSNAPEGTIFNQVLRGGDPAQSEDIGLIKRGQSGDGLYNPSTESVQLNAGDVLVSRQPIQGETQWVVGETRTIPGSSGAVGPGATVFQGEQDTTYNGIARDTLIGMVDGGAEGETLDLDQTIPRDQETGVYTDLQGNTVTVTTPQISRLDIINQNGERIDEGGEVRTNEFVIVRADVNFLEAERARISLIDPDTDSRITDGIISRQEAINRFPNRANFIQDTVPQGKAEPLGPDGTFRSILNAQTNARDTVYLIQDLNAVQKAGDYEYRITGADREPFGDFFDAGVQRTRAISLVSAATPTLQLPTGNESVTQGAFVQYRLERSSAGSWHVVSLSADDLRSRLTGQVDVGEITQVFREFGDGGVVRGVLMEDGSVITNDRRVFQNGNLVNTNGPTTVDSDNIVEVLTLVEVGSGGVGVNQLDSGRLDDSSIDLNLFQAFATADGALADYEQADGDNEIQEITIRVEQASEALVINNPGRTYIAGDRIDVRGRANPATDFVSLYARDQGDWELITNLGNVPVESDGSWEEQSTDLSQSSRILRVPGNYRIGIIDLNDADLDGDGNADQRLTTTEFSQGASQQRGIQVVRPGLTAELTSYNGQVATDDGTVNITGSATGAREVMYIFVDDQGDTAVSRDTVDTSNNFENEDVPVSNVRGDLSEGPIEVFVISPGRDTIMGQSGEGPDTVQQFVNFVEQLGMRGLTQEQVVANILEESVNDTGSDDLAERFQFQYTDGDTSVTDVVPAGVDDASGVMPIELGETMVIRGVTNLRSDDNTIILEMIEGPDAPLFDVAAADDWTSSGRWSVELQVPENVETGTYTLRADDGISITSLTIEIVDQREEPTPTVTATATETEPEPTETETVTATATQTAPEPSPTPTETEMVTESDTATGTETEQDTPGFTLIVAVVALALLAAGLLARRQRR